MSYKTEIQRQALSAVDTRYCGNIGFLLDFCRDVDRLHIDTEATSLYDISFRHPNDVVAITQRNIKLHVISIPTFNVALVSDKDENAINNGNHVLFHLSKCSDKLYGNIVLKDGNRNEHLKFDLQNFLSSPYIN